MSCANHEMGWPLSSRHEKATADDAAQSNASANRPRIRKGVKLVHNEERTDDVVTPPPI